MRFSMPAYGDTMARGPSDRRCPLDEIIVSLREEIRGRVIPNNLM